MSDRKYRQRGYQDDERGERRERRPQKPRERREGPRGRGLGAPTKMVFRCAACGQRAAVAEVTSESVCDSCGTDLRTCTHCRHFDTSARFECRQEIPEPIKSKTRRNTCDLFEPRQAQEFDSDRPDPDDARAAFDALFKL